MTEAPRAVGAPLEELLRLVGARQAAGPSGTVLTEVCQDSRDVRPGALFVAREGQHGDGAKYLSDALERGATAVLSSKPLEVPSTVASLVHPDPASVLGVLAQRVWGNPARKLRLVGVTGTNGKTTVSWLAAQALEALGAKAALLGTIEQRFGERRWPATHTTPEADALARRMAELVGLGATHLVMEVSSHALSLGRVGGLGFATVGLTNLSVDHLDFHGTMAAYAAAKRALFTDYDSSRRVLNLDDGFGREVSSVTKDLLGYSAKGSTDADLRVVGSELSAEGIVAEVDTPEGELELESPLRGEFNLENLLCALGLVQGLGFSYSKVARALRSAKGAPGRMEPVSGPEGSPAVLVDYAHTPDALVRTLGAVRGWCRGRLLCVFGCGGARDPSKRAPMGEAVATGADVAVLTTDNPRTEQPEAIAAQAATGLLSGGMPRLVAEGLQGAARGYVLELDRRRAIRLAIAAARPGDVVLIAGKGHEPYQQVGHEKRHFDDREEARAALAQRGAR